MTILDHGLVFIIAIAYPIAGVLGFRRLLKRVAAGENVNRRQLYRNTAISHWLLFFMCVVIWNNLARPWSALGLSLELDLWFGLGTVLTILGIGALVMQIRHVSAATSDELTSIKQRFGNLSVIIPQNGNELARFYGLSVTAGIVEEVLWRGFLIWYLNQFMPLWGAALVSTIGFTLAHAYQGLRHLPQIAAVSTAFAALYLLSGSIWLPIILHAAVDILQGRLGYTVMYRSAMNNKDGKIRGQTTISSASSHR